MLFVVYCYLFQNMIIFSKISFKNCHSDKQYGSRLDPITLSGLTWVQNLQLLPDNDTVHKKSSILYKHSNYTLF